LISRSKALPVYLPELERYLLEYPKAKIRKHPIRVLLGESKFGLKPTLRVVQAIVYRGPRSTDPAYAVAVKQLYASHYFEDRSGFDRLLRDQESPDRGFYLITLKVRSRLG